MPWITTNPTKTSFYVKDWSSLPDGSRKAVHIGTFDTRSDAQARVEELKRVKGSSKKGIDYSKGSKPFRSYVEQWRDEVAKLNKGYEKSDKYVIAAMLAANSSSKPLMDKNLSAISEDDIEEWMAIRRDDGISESTLRRQFTYLQGIFKTCRLKWKIRWINDPTISVKKPKGGKSRSRRINTREQKKIIEVAIKSGYKYLAMVTEFALETAMRQGEIGSAKVIDYDVEHKTLFIPDSKNGEVRTIPLSNRAVAIIEMALESRKNDTGLIFNATGNAIKIAWQRTITEEAGFKDLHFHDLRHEATSRFFEAGVLSTEQIKSITGHKTYSCLTHYTHLNARHTGKVMRGERVMMEAAEEELVA